MSEQELPRVGLRVRVITQPGCAGEFRAHGIAPSIRMLIGVVQAIDTQYGQHCVRVRFWEWGHDFHMWFSPDELEEVQP